MQAMDDVCASHTQNNSLSTVQAMPYICVETWAVAKKSRGKWFIWQWPADWCDCQTVWSVEYKSHMTAQPDSYKMQSDFNMEYSEINLLNGATFRNELKYVYLF